MYSPKLPLLFLCLVISNTAFANEQLPNLNNLSLDDLQTTEEVIVPNNETDTKTFLSLVPNLIGKNIEGIAGELEAYHLTLGKVTMVQNNTPAGHIIKQSESPNSNIKQWSSIDVTVSTGPEEANKKTPSKERSNADTAFTSTEAKDTQTTENKTVDIPAPEIVEPVDSEQATDKNSNTQNNNQKTTVEKDDANEPDTKTETSTETKTTPNNTETDQLTTNAAATNNTQPANNEVAPPEKEAPKTEPSTTAVAITEETPVTKNIEITETNPDQQKAEDKETAANNDTIEETPVQKNNMGDVTIKISPQASLQAKRNITFTVIPPEEMSQKSLEYILNISGKTYRQTSPEFTHKFEEPDWVIVTGSARIPGKPWHHSNSRKIEIEEYVAKKIKVPSVVGKNEKDATATLKRKGLVVGNVQMKNIGDKTGIVEQRPKAGSMLTEDNNKVYLVKAVGHKYKVAFSADHTEAEAKTPIKFTTRITPAPTKKVSYRFIVDGKKQIVQETEWTYEFTTPGQHKASVEAIVAGEGAFTSPEILINIEEPWQKPLAIISPSSITLEAGETILFENLSSGQTDKVLQTNWLDHQGQTSNSKDLSIDTNGLAAGDYHIKLTVKDERDFESEAKATFKIQEKAAPKNETDNTLTALVDEATKTETDVIETPSPIEENQTTKETSPADANLHTQPVVDSEKTVDEKVEEPASTQKSLAESKNMTFWLWMTVLIVLFYAIFWFVRKLK
jgi:beta-lactam-binding protein with PASTA domain